MAKGKTIAFTIADDNNLPHAGKMIKTWNHFHPDIEVKVIAGDELLDYLKHDPDFFYRATPTIANKLFRDYETVIKLDADQLCLGSMKWILNQDYDVGCVLNINRVDPNEFGTITISGVVPRDYVNCGFVVMKNGHFIGEWLDLCHQKVFGNLQYREQDLLNVLVHYRPYKVKMFDFYDHDNEYFAWHGIVAKGETMHTELRDGEVFVLPDDSNYPDKELKLKMYHFGGGKFSKKMNYQTIFPEDVIKFIDDILYGKE